MAVRLDYHELPLDANGSFPAHGWIESAVGVKVVRLPVMRLYQPFGPTYQLFVKHKLGGTWLQFRSPIRTLRHLGVCLRDIHREAREILPLIKFQDAPPSESRNDALARQSEGLERFAVLLLAAFTLLRRLADELISVSRPLLFEHWQSAHREMKNAIPAARTGTLAKLKPICDLSVLENALVTRTAWFEQLREDNGIRDILVHRPHLLQMGHGGTSSDGGITWTYQLDALLIQQRKGEGGMTSVALIPALLGCVQGACHFMQGLVEAVRYPSGYERSDLLSLTGNSNDISGGWPPIRATTASFPLVD